MRLADFILANIEPILAEWEAFARGIWPAGAAAAGPAALRDHAEDILRAAARDMALAQTAAERYDKSRGDGDGSRRLDGASEVHAVGRVGSGFDLPAVVAEYRALRASVVRLWRASGPDPDLRDIDDLTRFNETIDQSLTEAVRSYTGRVDRSRQTFLAILGHDLRNPLNAITLSAEALSAGDTLDAASAEMATGIASSAEAMARLVADLLDFAGTGLGAGMPLCPAAVDLGAVCREVVHEMRAAHPGRAVRCEARGELAGEWDAARLRQVVSNLLGNALQHGPEAGPVDLSAAPDGPDGVVLAVHNGGAPIPPDALTTIFDPMVRGTSPDSRRQRRPGSIGLGLYIAREVVVGHGGTIGVASSADAGTVFTVRLPRRGSRRGDRPARSRPVEITRPGDAQPRVELTS
jgi:signal transduction histidine kinase